MSTLFITEQGSRVVCRQRTLLVQREGETVFIYPLDSLETLVLMGRVELSTSAIGKLLHRGVSTVFLQRDGRFKGRLCGGLGKNILIREKQFAARQNTQTCLHISRALVSAKIKNARAFIRRTAPGLVAVLDQRLQNAEISLEKAGSLEVIRGIEGGFANLYFGRFAALLKNPLGFKKRQKNPPPDPVNILLSLGYTLLFNQMWGFVETAGLDPYAGFLHQSAYGHPALVSDLIEPFRHPLVDRLVVSCLNNEIITEKDFEKDENGFRFLPEGLRRFVGKYEELVFNKQKEGSRKVTAVLKMRETVWKLCHYLEGKSDAFTAPFVR
ncbi:MAG: CRISPR-associated endonuclease Cas1 [Calditrichia bacterium]